MSIARPLHDIVKKDRKWEWTEKQEKVFEELKKKFIQELVLAALDLDKKNEDGSGCFRLHYRRCIINGRRRWKMETSCISLKVLK